MTQLYIVRTKPQTMKLEAEEISSGLFSLSLSSIPDGEYAVVLKQAGKQAQVIEHFSRYNWENRKGEYKYWQLNPEFIWT